MRQLISLMLAVVLCLSLAVVPVMAEPRTVKLSPQKFMVNGQNVDCEKYNIDGSNYFKLRDLAFVLSGTLKQFSVGWDSASRTVSIETGKAYTPEGGELTPGNGMPQTAVVSTQTIMIDGVKVSDISVYNIGGNNYFKLRDLAGRIGFIVDYDEATNTAIVMSEDGGNTAKPQPDLIASVASMIPFPLYSDFSETKGSITQAEYDAFLSYLRQLGFTEVVSEPGCWERVIAVHYPTETDVSIFVRYLSSNRTVYLNGYGLAEDALKDSDMNEVLVTDADGMYRFMKNVLEAPLAAPDPAVGIYYFPRRHYTQNIDWGKTYKSEPLEMTLTRQEAEIFVSALLNAGYQEAGYKENYTDYILEKGPYTVFLTLPRDSVNHALLANVYINYEGKNYPPSGRSIWVTNSRGLTVFLKQLTE